MIHHNKTQLIGAHLSISGGLSNALYRGQELGCTCVQIFTHSSRQWKMPPLHVNEIKLFLDGQKETGISCIAAHASYLINIASPKESVRKQSITALTHELMRCEELQIALLIIHPGAALNSAPAAGLYKISEALQSIFDQVPHLHTRLLLENMAGQGSSLGSTLTELAELYHALPSSHEKRLGICIDTCHAFAQGYAIDTEAGYKLFWEEFQEILGMQALGALHINDSLKPRGSKVDRHTHLGQGMLGAPFFWRIMHDSRFAHIPKILETPTDTLRGDAENIAFLHYLTEKNAPPSY